MHTHALTLVLTAKLCVPKTLLLAAAGINIYSCFVYIEWMKSFCLDVQAALQSVKEEEEAPPPLPVEAPPRPPTATPVSKWTLVDYDEDNPPDDLEG